MRRGRRRRAGTAIAAAVRSWADGFKSALLARFDEAYALQLFAKYAPGFPAAYTEDFSGDRRRSTCPSSRRWTGVPPACISTSTGPSRGARTRLFLKIFRGQDAMPISDLLPMLENMGLKVIAERPYELEFAGGIRAPGSRISNS
jgi:glutamate dehydrogenase